MLFRFYFLAGVISLTMAAFVFRLWYLQVISHEKYVTKVHLHSQVTVRIPAVRGEIMDRNGIPLVENRASYDVDFYLPDMVRAYKEHTGKVPLIRYRGTVREMPADLSEPDIEKIVEQVIKPTLERYDLATDYNSHLLQVHFRNKSEVPFPYRQDIDFATLAKYSERNLDLPGVSITVKPVRDYVYGALAAHLLGYVGMPNDLDKLPDIGKYKFYQPDVEGKSQIELFMDQYLKGEPGVKIIQRDAKGMVISGEEEIVAPKQGDNVYLTIDARIEYIAEQALRAVGRGAAVVLDVNTGNILAMASVPSFDPNQFVPTIPAKAWNALNSDDTEPLLNRATAGFAPGSTFKIATSLAGMRAGIGDKTYNCSGGVSYGNVYMHCWVSTEHFPPHGTLGLSDALKVSCDSFFYQYGNAAGIDQIDAVGAMLGLGQKSGIPLSAESAGLLPGPEWLAKISPQDRWSQGYTANTSIGQGAVLASPLQMAVVAASVANGGTVYFPRLIDKVVSQDGVVVLQDPSKVRSNLITDAGIKPEQLDKIRKGLWKVVNESGGTACHMPKMPDGIQVAGKTGTAQNWSMRDGKRMKDNHAWFVGYAPFDKPRYAIAVIVQGGKAGGGVAGPIAAKILNDTFMMDKGKEPVLAKLEPAAGNFNQVQSVDFGRALPAATSAAAPEEDETASSEPSPDEKQTPQHSAATAAPDIRQDADARGKVKNQPRKASPLEKFFNFFGGKKH